MWSMSKSFMHSQQACESRTSLAVAAQVPILILLKRMEGCITGTSLAVCCAFETGWISAKQPTSYLGEYLLPNDGVGAVPIPTSQISTNQPIGGARSFGQPGNPPVTNLATVQKDETSFKGRAYPAPARGSSLSSESNKAMETPLAAAQGSILLFAVFAMPCLRDPPFLSPLNHVIRPRTPVGFTERL